MISPARRAILSQRAIQITSSRLKEMLASTSFEIQPPRLFPANINDGDHRLVIGAHTGADATSHLRKIESR